MLKWIFGADVSPFKKGLNEMRDQTKALASDLKGQLAGALGLGVIIGYFKQLFNEMGRVQDLADRFGERAETVQKIGLAAKQYGSDLEGVAKALTVVTKNAFEAATGNDKFAKAFEALGIDAGQFVNLPMDEKLVLLAQAMEQGRGNGEKLALVMQILGKSGGDLVPLLSQGSEELKAFLANASAVDDSTVEFMAYIGDKFDELKQKLQVLASYVVGGFRVIGAAVSYLFDQFVTNAEAAGTNISNIFAGVGKVVRAIFSFDIDNIKDAIKEIDRIKSLGFARFMADSEKNLDSLKEKFGKILDARPKGGGSGGYIEDLEGAAEEAAKKAEETEKKKEKLAERRKQIEEEIGKFVEERGLRALSIQERIAYLMSKRDNLRGVAGLNSDEGVEASKEILEITKEITKLQDDDAADRKKTEEDTAKKRLDLAKEIAELEEEAALSKLTTEEKIAALQGKRAGLEKALAGKSGLDALEIRKQILETDKEIDPLKKEVADKKEDDLKKLRDKLEDVQGQRPELVTSALASVGGGGPAAIFGKEDLARKQADLLAQIKDLLARGLPGSTSKPIEPSA